MTSSKYSSEWLMLLSIHLVFNCHLLRDLSGRKVEEDEISHFVVKRDQSFEVV